MVVFCHIEVVDYNVNIYKYDLILKITHNFLHSNDVDMETDHYSNGVAETSSNGFLNGSSKHDHEMEECDTEMGLQ